MTFILSDSTAIAPNSQRGLSYPVQQPSPRINGTRLEYSETTLGSLFILVIAVGEDIECLKFLWLTPGVSEPGRINFHSLDKQVSLAKVYDAIKRLYNEAADLSDSEFLILLTGHGNGANRMELHGGEFIGETDLYNFFEGLKPQDTNSTPILITILFDICREARKPSIGPPDGITLIWSSSPGENASGFRLRHDPKIPHSCFLLASMMASRTLDPGCTGETLKKSVDEHLDQLTVYLKEVYSLKHTKGKCHPCNSNGILMFAEALRGTDAAQEARRLITTVPMFRRANKLPVVAQKCPENMLPPSPTAASATNTNSDLGNIPKYRTRGHMRGASGSVRAA